LPHGATLYDKFDEYRINGWVQNKTMLKYARIYGNLVRHFEDVSNKYEPSDVVA